MQGQRGIFPHPEHRLTVVWIFEEAAAGTSPAEIAYRLNDRGVPTTDARKWDRSGIARLLRHPGYYGAVMHKGEVVCESGDHEPLVSRELWDRAQQAAVARKRLPASGGGRRPNGRHLLRGLLRCGICGRNLTTRTYKGTGRGAYYCPAERQERQRCPGHGPYPQHVVDGAVLDYFARVGLDMEATREAFAEHAERRIAEARAIVSGAEREHARAAAALSRVRRDYQQGAISAGDWQRPPRRAQPELRASEAALEQARAAEVAAVEGADLRDAETDVLRHLSELRRSIVEQVRDAEDAARVRGALVRLFDGFTLHDEDAMARAALRPSRTASAGITTCSSPRQTALGSTSSRTSGRWSSKASTRRPLASPISRPPRRSRCSGGRRSYLPSVARRFGVNGLKLLSA